MVFRSPARGKKMIRERMRPATFTATITCAFSPIDSKPPILEYKGAFRETQSSRSGKVCSLRGIFVVGDLRRAEFPSGAGWRRPLGLHQIRNTNVEIRN